MPTGSTNLDYRHQCWPSTGASVDQATSSPSNEASQLRHVPLTVGKHWDQCLGYLIS
jgi:hypothetical protein